MGAYEEGKASKQKTNNKTLIRLGENTHRIILHSDTITCMCLCVVHVLNTFVLSQAPSFRNCFYVF